MDKPIDEKRDERTGNVIHLPSPTSLSRTDQRLKEVELSIAAHFRQQNDMLRADKKELTDRLKRLTIGVERLVAEMHGVRTGQKEEAFARVAGVGASPDLPSVNAEAALVYIHTAKQIGSTLGFQASQIGLLLGRKGLRWAGNGDYQEIGRTVSVSQSKFWHREVPDRLRRVLDENQPEKYDIRDKSVLAIFRRWRERQSQNELLKELEVTSQPH